MNTRTKYWHTWIEGYRARVTNIPKEKNWYAKVRPNTADSNLWDEGWESADKDLAPMTDRIQALESGFLQSKDALGNRVYIYTEAQYQQVKRATT